MYDWSSSIQQVAFKTRLLETGTHSKHTETRLGRLRRTCLCRCPCLFCPSCCPCRGPCPCRSCPCPHQKMERHILSRTNKRRKQGQCNTYSTHPAQRERSATFTVQRVRPLMGAQLMSVVSRRMINTRRTTITAIVAWTPAKTLEAGASEKRPVKTTYIPPWNGVRHRSTSWPPAWVRLQRTNKTTRSAKRFQPENTIPELV